MCSVGSGSNTSFASASATATGAGGQSIGGSVLGGATRVQGGGARGTLLAGSSNGPTGSTGSSNRTPTPGTGGNSGGTGGNSGGTGGGRSTGPKSQQYR